MSTFEEQEQFSSGEAGPPADPHEEGDSWRRALDPPTELVHNGDPWRRISDPPPELVHSTDDAWQRAQDPPSALTHSTDPWRRSQNPLLDPTRGAFARHGTPGRRPSRRHSPSAPRGATTAP